MQKENLRDLQHHTENWQAEISYLGHVSLLTLCLAAAQSSQYLPGQQFHPTAEASLTCKVPVSKLASCYEYKRQRVSHPKA